MRRTLAFLSAALLMIAAPVRADSFVLTPPSYLNLDFEGNVFIFVASGFSARQDFESTIGNFFIPSPPGCDPCTVGETFNPSFTVTNTFMGTGPATVGSATFQTVRFFGDLSFAATPLAFPATNADFIEIHTPFTFTGTLRGFEADQLAFSAALTGAGFASRTFDCCTNDGRYVAAENRLSYFFTTPAPAVPEPASMLLLGTGIASLAARKRLTRASPGR